MFYFFDFLFEMVYFSGLFCWEFYRVLFLVFIVFDDERVRCEENNVGKKKSFFFFVGRVVF